MFNETALCFPESIRTLHNRKHTPNKIVGKSQQSGKAQTSIIINGKIQWQTANVQLYCRSWRSYKVYGLMISWKSLKTVAWRKSADRGWNPCWLVTGSENSNVSVNPTTAAVTSNKQKADGFQILPWLNPGQTPAVPVSYFRFKAAKCQIQYWQSCVSDCMSRFTSATVRQASFIPNGLYP